MLFKVLSFVEFLNNKKRANTACTRPPEEHRDYSGGSLRVFRPFAWLGVGSDKMALSRPATSG